MKEGFRELLEQFLGRNKSIEINKYLYEELEEHARQQNIPIYYFINDLIRESLDLRKKAINDKDEWLKNQIRLVPYYQFLDRYLYATLDNKIEIGITNDLAGRETSQDIYTLTDYKLSKKYRSLRLSLTKNECSYPISFYEIEDIKFSDLENRLKVWIYMPHKTWRFYLYFNQENLTNDFESGKLELDE